MEYKEITLEAFTVVGISVRTTNKDGKFLTDIPALWNIFFEEQTLATIPNKISDNIYCMYTDYESNFQGEYTTIIGCKVSSIENLPEGLITKQIPECKYRLYHSEGEMNECAGKTWMHIWQLPDTDRKYEADFDIYGIEAQNPENAVVFTYLSVK